MKLISLNTWGSKLKPELEAFVKKHSEDTDIFCFQEVFDNAVGVRKSLGDIDIHHLENLKKLLPNHVLYYDQIQENEEGLATFVKSGIQVEKSGSQFVFRHANALVGDDSTTLGRMIQYVQFTNDGQQHTIINFHGLWNGQGKSDTADRLEQSQKIRDFIDQVTSENILLIGDFNLLPGTESLAILEKDMRNLITEYNIKSTRSDHYKKPLQFADYAIVSNNLRVDSFKVLPDQVSDHLPLLLEFH